MKMKSLQANNENIMKEAREERERILKARDMKNSIVNEAKETAAAEAETVVAAKAAIDAERAAAVAELKNQAALLSIEVAERVLAKS